MIESAKKQFFKLKETTNVAIPTIPQPEGRGQQDPEVQPRQP